MSGFASGEVEALGGAADADWDSLSIAPRQMWKRIRFFLQRPRCGKIGRAVSVNFNAG